MKQAVTALRRKDSTRAAVLYLGFELGRKEWKLGFTTGMAQKPRERTIPAGDVSALEAEIEGSRRRLGLAAGAEVVSCYEAGRDGFWLHRLLESYGYTNHVVDSSSLEVKRRAKRVKTDHLDLLGLLRLLIRFHSGERHVWSVVNVPSTEAEDARQLHRELLAARRDRTRTINRMKGLMATQGMDLELRPGFEAALKCTLLWDGLPVPDQLRMRLARDWQRLLWHRKQVREVEAERNRLFRDSTEPAIDKVRQLYDLCGIGIESAWLFVMEFFAWREFTNRRQVGGLAGLTPTPFQSGESRREQGIAKAGNPNVRWMAIEIAWSWLRYQPESALTQWYNTKFGSGSSRIRRIGIVALARRLLIELWRYLETGALPEGALTKT
jgi:transposase